MQKILLKNANYLVILREYERGWGSKDFHAAPFEKYEDAKNYRDSVNAKNTADTAPDYYIQARIETDPETFKSYERYL